ncbi:oleosin 16.4 kDa isoform X2 [Nicotiana tomentosiformis]|uniref:oleosin 16.4 kDa isoform X2 n=1 Tax=Nicotiana tomentosiformis TaxID=4098 RepID=UPI00051C442B|nr:oleosin 16.4 kDa [Nicotiana tomentosiformis]
MAENGQMMDIVNPQQVSRRTLILATLAGIAVEGPLLGMMGFSFLTSLIILVVTSPLLLIFSPLLFGAACVFAFAIAGFGVAGTIAFAGLSSFVLVYRSLIKGVRKTGIDYGDTDNPAVTVDKMIQPDETVAKEQQQLDTEVAGNVDRIETVKEQQEDTSVPVTRIVELFESLKEHPHDSTTAVEEHRPESPGYLQQNVQREIPLEI